MAKTNAAHSRGFMQAVMLLCFPHITYYTKNLSLGRVIIHKFFVYLLFIIYNPQLKPLYKQQKTADMREKSHISRSYFLIKNLLHHQPER